jgi:hypothetical protein
MSMSVRDIQFSSGKISCVEVGKHGSVDAASLTLQLLSKYGLGMSQVTMFDFI